jgi:hypothetical protein
MKINQTKCDHCGKVHDWCSASYNRTVECHLRTDDLQMPRLDFCNEDCMREFLVVRKWGEQEVGGLLEAINSMGLGLKKIGPLKIGNTLLAQAKARAENEISPEAQINTLHATIYELRKQHASTLEMLASTKGQVTFLVGQTIRQSADIKLMVEALKVCGYHDCDEVSPCLLCDAISKALATETAKKVG